MNEGTKPAGKPKPPNCWWLYIKQDKWLLCNATSPTILKGEASMTRYIRIGILSLCLTVPVFNAIPLIAQSATVAKASVLQTARISPISEHDGQHDFDFDIGAWKTHVVRLQHPLTGSNDWTEYDGTTVVRKIWNGRANLAELEADGTAGHLEVLSLRLYNPQAHQWSLNTASSRSGTISVATIGEFKNGRGEFFDTESFNGRSI